MSPQHHQRCQQCGKTFTSNRCLNDHIRGVHAVRKFKCYHCNYDAKVKQHLVKHMKVHFKAHSTQKNPGLLCPMCSYRACDRKTMSHHYTEVHEVTITTKNLEFNSYDEFMTWKSSLQSTERCSFVVNGGPHKTPNKIHQKFRCFRDGFYSSRGNKKRRLKVSGSCKINGMCPAAISCSLDRHSGAVSVCYIPTHVGHGTDVGLLNLSKEEKRVIAQKIAAKVPYDIILNDFRESESSHQIDRANLVTRKDLWNIERQFNLKSTSDLNLTESTVPFDALEIEIVDDNSLSPPSIFEPLNQHSRHAHEDFEHSKHKVEEEFKKILEAATCQEHLDIITRNMRPCLAMMNAVNLGLQFKDSSKKINPCANVSPPKFFHPKKPRKTR